MQLFEEALEKSIPYDKFNTWLHSKLEGQAQKPSPKKDKLTTSAAVKK